MILNIFDKVKLLSKKFVCSKLTTKFILTLKNIIFYYNKHYQATEAYISQFTWRL